MVFIVTYTLASVFLALCVFACTKPSAPARTIIAIGCYGMTALALIGAFFAGGILFNSTTYLGDLWTAFDAIAKADAGQRASLDYFSPIGPVYAWTFSAALLLTMPSAMTVQMAAGLFALATLVLSVLILRRAMSPLGLAMACLVAVTIAVSPRGIGSLFAVGEINVLAPYNRWSWALFVPVVLRASLPVPTDDRLGSWLLGLAVAGLLLLKVTYGAAALGLIAIGAAVRPGGWREARDAALAMIVVLGALELATGQISTYLQDILTAARINADTLRILKFIAQAGEALIYCLFGILTLLVGYRAADRHTGTIITDPQFLRPALMILAAGGAGCAVLMQNYHLSEAAVYAVLPLIGAEWNRMFIRDALGPWAALPSPLPQAILLLIVLSVTRIALADTGFILAQRMQMERHPADPLLAGTPLADLRVHPRWLPPAENPCGTSVCRDYRRMVSGLEILGRAGAKRPGAGRVLALNFSNPFPMLLGTPSPNAVPIWLHVGRSFSTELYPPIKHAMTDVEYIMSAKISENAIYLREIYGPYIAENFDEIDQDVHWTLFRRRSE